MHKKSNKYNLERTQRKHRNGGSKSAHRKSDKQATPNGKESVKTLSKMISKHQGRTQATDSHTFQQSSHKREKSSNHKQQTILISGEEQQPIQKTAQVSQFHQADELLTENSENGSILEFIFNFNDKKARDKRARASQQQTGQDTPVLNVEEETNQQNETGSNNQFKKPLKKTVKHAIKA